MRTYISIIFGAILLSLASCTQEMEAPGRGVDGKNKVSIAVKSLGVAARSNDTEAESTVAWVDVYVMNQDYSIFHKERFGSPEAPLAYVKSGELTLDKGIEDFVQGSKYYIYLVANSTAPICNSWEELTELEQIDLNVNITGLPVDIAPKYFLMDGYAYKGVDPRKFSSFVINDGSDDEVVLSGNLCRAASKIIVNIAQGESVDFQTVLNNATPLYSFYQLPVSTLVVDPAKISKSVNYVCEKQNTHEWGIDPRTLNWVDPEGGRPYITLTAYAYSNDWKKQSVNETALLLSVPMYWDADDDGVCEKACPVNWYKVPVSQDSKFERNKCYTVNVTINAVGALEKNVPIEILDVQYVTQPWVKEEIYVDDERPRYLTLNTECVKIYDSNVDLDQLRFTSSSPIKSIRLMDTYGDDGAYAYYIDKFGQTIQLGTDPGFDIKVTEKPELGKEEILALERNLYQKEGAAEQHIRAVVPEEYKHALNGDIHIYSPIYPIEGNDDLDWNSHFNTVRYLEFEVMNEQGVTAIFRVEQYPLSVIRHEEGFYSFRDDHVLTDDPMERPFDYFRYDMDFHSVMTSSMHLIHPHDFTDEPTSEAYWNKPQSDRDYSWMRSANNSYVWLHPSDNSCASQGSTDEQWVEIRYGFYDNVVQYHDASGKLTSKTFSGIYRAVKDDRPYSDYFYRQMYKNLPGELAITNKSYKGTPLSPYYEAVVEVNGVKQTRVFRDHYRWNAQPIFWSKFVGKYYDEPGVSVHFSNAQRKRGQVDIHEYGPTDDGGKTWGKYYYSSNLPKFANHRMYSIVTTNTSDAYTLAYPRKTAEGRTENTVYNSMLVSPNLVLASQLGETNHQQFLNNAKSYNYIIPNIKEMYVNAERHCNEYVETTFEDLDGDHMWDEGERIIEYHDWRLPTKAEIEAIIEFQSNSRAMDRVLDAQYYYCITGSADSDDLSNIHNWVSRQIPGFDGSTSKGYYIRCVRDANRK